MNWDIFLAALAITGFILLGVLIFATIINVSFVIADALVRDYSSATHCIVYLISCFGLIGIVIAIMAGLLL